MTAQRMEPLLRGSFRGRALAPGAAAGAAVSDGGAAGACKPEAEEPAAWKPGSAGAKRRSEARRKSRYFGGRIEVRTSGDGIGQEVDDHVGVGITQSESMAGDSVLETFGQQREIEQDGGGN